MDLVSLDPLESMKALEGIGGVREIAVFGGGLHLTVEDPGKTGGRIREVLRGKGIAIRSLELIPPSMEDVFVAMIEEEEKKAS